MHLVLCLLFSALHNIHDQKRSVKDLILRSSPQFPRELDLHLEQRLTVAHDGLALRVLIVKEQRKCILQE